MPRGRPKLLLGDEEKKLRQQEQNRVRGRKFYKK
jgi:hypothetical protein